MVVVVLYNRSGLQMSSRPLIGSRPLMSSRLLVNAGLLVRPSVLWRLCRKTGWPRVALVIGPVYRVM